MKKAFLGFLLLFLITPFLFAQEDNARQEIIELSKTKWQWMAEKDVDKLADLFDDKAVFVRSTGKDVAWPFC